MRGTILVRRFTDVTAKLRAGEYIVHRDTKPANVALACPCCGAVAELDQEHVVDTGGTVSPIWCCPSEACAAITWLELECWGAGP